MYMRTRVDHFSALTEVVALTTRPLMNGSGWYVEVTRRDGAVERIGTFGSETTARDWVEWDAARFLRDSGAHPLV